METAETTALLVSLACLEITHQSRWMPLDNAAGAHLDQMAHPAPLALLVPLETKAHQATVDLKARTVHPDLPDHLATLATKPQTESKDHKVLQETMPPLVKKATTDPLVPEESLDKLATLATKVPLAKMATRVNPETLVLLAKVANLATKDKPAHLDRKVDLVWMPSTALVLAAAIKHLLRLDLGRITSKKFSTCSEMLRLVSVGLSLCICLGTSRTTI